MFTIICFFNIYCIYILLIIVFTIILLIIIGNPQSREYTRMKIKTLMKWKDAIITVADGVDATL